MNQFIFLKFIIWSKMYLMMALGLLLFLTLSEIPKISPLSLTKYSKSLFVHLFVSWAKRTFSCENSSSKSKSSRGGFGNYLNTGGKTPGAKPKSGTSNCGTIKVNCSCFTSMLLYNEIASGTRSKSYLKRLVSNIVVKSLGSSSPSWIIKKLHGNNFSGNLQSQQYLVHGCIQLVRHLIW